MGDIFRNWLREPFIKLRRREGLKLKCQLKWIWVKTTASNYERAKRFILMAVMDLFFFSLHKHHHSGLQRSTCCAVVPFPEDWLECTLTRIKHNETWCPECLSALVRSQRTHIHLMSFIWILIHAQQVTPKKKTAIMKWRLMVWYHTRSPQTEYMPVGRIVYSACMRCCSMCFFEGF